MVYVYKSSSLKKFTRGPHLKNLQEDLTLKIYKRTSLKQSRIHGNTVADGWAGAVMQKLLGIQKCDGQTDRPTDRPTRQGVESRVRD